jgi:hypothetical protein
MVITRLVALLGAGAALLVLGYYVGREVGRMAPIRAELEKARDRLLGP